MAGKLPPANRLALGLGVPDSEDLGRLGKISESGYPKSSSCSRAPTPGEQVGECQVPRGGTDPAGTPQATAFRGRWRALRVGNCPAEEVEPLVCSGAGTPPRPEPPAKILRYRTIFSFFVLYFTISYFFLPFAKRKKNLNKGK